MIITDKDKAILLAYVDIEEDTEEGRKHAINQFLKNSDYSKKYSYEYLENVLIKTLGTIVEIKAELKPKVSLKDISTIKEGENFKRYCTFLKEKRNFNSADISKIKIDTKRIMEKINVIDGISFLIKGLVIGDIQSGKTANFAGLISLAFDMGYHAVIVLSGMTDDLRSQTSERLTSDFGILIDDIDEEYLEDLSWDNEIMNLTISEDFNKRQIAQYRANSNKKHFFVIKKNKSRLENAVKYFDIVLPKVLKYANQKFLIIDDEVDQASQDGSKKDSGQVTTINGLVCDLISKFKKVSYIGYTATPFAPVLADQNSKHNDINLFPSDFIYLLKSNEKYTGYYSFLSEESDLNSEIINYIDENDLKTLDGLLKGEYNNQIFENIEIFSLFNAFKTFLISSALVEICNEQEKITDKLPEKSMLINISARTTPQTLVHNIINFYIKKLSKWNRSDIYNEFILNYMSQYNNYCNIIDFNIIVEKIIRIIKLIKIYEINTNNSTQKIIEIKKKIKDEILGNNYAYSIYIGGHKLSRGITIEGLLVSYFYRNSSLYDAAMQMCRWFGYRKNYLEFIKIYSSEKIFNNLIKYFEAFELFKSYISNKLELGMSIAEIRHQILYAPKTKPTSANKMKGAELAIPRILQTRDQIYEYYKNPELIKINYNLTNALLSKYERQYDCDFFSLYQNIPFYEIKELCSNLKLPEKSTKKIKGLLKDIEKIKNDNFDQWNIVIPNLKHSKNGEGNLGNNKYKLSLKKCESILLENSTNEYYFPLKVILNSQIEHFQEIMEDLQNGLKPRNFTNNKKIIENEKPVLFIFNAIIQVGIDEHAYKSEWMNLYAFNFPTLSEEFRDEIDLNYYWINVSNDEIEN